MTEESSIIYSKLRQKIILLKLAPGAKVSESSLVEKYHVSRTPVRDVLKLLEAEKLITIRSKSGSYVTKIDLSGIEDIITLRAEVETSTLYHLRGSLSAEQREHLESLYEEQDILIHQNEWKDRLFFASRLSLLDDSFHSYIYSLNGKKSMYDTLDEAFPTYHRFRVMTYLREDSDLDSFLANHRAILSYLYQESQEPLETIVHRHNFTGLELINKIRHAYPEYFKN